MLIEFLYELKESISKHGIRWGVVLTFFVFYRKELRNRKLDLRDEAYFHNMRVIMDELGVGDQWHGPAKISHADLVNYKPLQQSYSAVISRVGYQLRRGSKMSRAWIITLVAYVLGAAAKKWGFVWPDETANWIADGLLMLIPVALAFMNKTKKQEVPKNGSVILTEDNR